MTGYAVIGTDLVWSTVCRVVSSGMLVVRQNGSNVISPFLADSWYTGDAVHSALVADNARHTLNANVVPLKLVAGKVTGQRRTGAWSLDDFASKMGLPEAELALLKATYTTIESIAA
jgi:hypothetical protein